MVGPGLGQGQRGERKRRGLRIRLAVAALKDLEEGGNTNTAQVPGCSVWALHVL